MEDFRQDTVINVTDGTAAITSSPFKVGGGSILDIVATSAMTGVLTVEYSDDAETWFPSGLVFGNPDVRQTSFGVDHAAGRVLTCLVLAARPSVSA